VINPLRSPQGRGTARAFPIAAPLQGLNTRDNYTLLQPTEARVLENWLPDEGACKVRPGHEAHQTISGASAVPSLMKFEGASSQTIIAAAGGELYDVSSTPSAITSSASYTDNLWSYENFNGWMFGVNASDTPWRYDGSASTSATGFTGVTLTDLQTVTMVRERLWFTVNNSADVEYGGLGAVTGALTAFQISQVAAGGKCMDVGSWSRDAGDGSDDFTVFVMSTGEVIVYQGDPSTTFDHVGSYRAPAPVGPDCTVKVGGELVVMTASGPIPLSAILAGNAFHPEALREWGRIAPSWAQDYDMHGTNSGWTAYFFEGLVYFVVPTGLDSNKIYVFNTRNSAWTTYTNLPAAMFADLNGELYFGAPTSNNVFRHGTGSDNGDQIVTLARQGWTYPDASNTYQYTLLKPNIAASGPAQAQFQVDTEFTETALSAELVDLSVESEGAAWDEEDWDDAEWAGDAETHKLWYPIRGKGRSVAPVVRTYSTSDSVEWYATDVMAKRGGLL